VLWILTGQQGSLVFHFIVCWLKYLQIYLKPFPIILAGGMQVATTSLILEMQPKPSGKME